MRYSSRLKTESCYDTKEKRCFLFHSHRSANLSYIALLMLTVSNHQTLPPSLFLDDATMKQAFVSTHF